MRAAWLSRCSGLGLRKRRKGGEPRRRTDTRTNAKNGQAGGCDGETRRGAKKAKEKRKEMVEAKLRERWRRERSGEKSEEERREERSEETRGEEWRGVERGGEERRGGELRRRLRSRGMV